MSEHIIHSDEDNSLGLESIFSDLRRYAVLFVVVFAAVFAVVFVAMYAKTPTYTSTASLMINQANQQQIPGQNEQATPVDTAAIDSEVELIKSNAVADRVVKQLHLDGDPEFNGSAAAHGTIGQLKAMLHIGGDQNPDAAAGGSPLAAQLKEQSLVNAVLSKLNVQRVGTTNIIKVTFTSTSKTKAALLANTWAQAYIQDKDDSYQAANSQANGWLSSRIDDLRKQVEDADRQVQEYKIAHNLLSADGATLTEQEISDLNKQLASVKVDQAESSARLSTAQSQLNNGSNGGDVGEALNSPVISGLRAQAAQISSHLAELQGRYGPMHPEVIKAKNQLADINAQIDAEIKRIMSNLDAQNRIQEQRTGSLEGSVNHAQAELVGNSKAMVKLNELVLNAQSARQIYESYLDRFKQTVTQSGAQMSNASIVADGKVATGPSSPQLALSLLFAFAAASVVSGGTVAGRRALDSGLTTSQDVERQLHTKFMGSILTLRSTLNQKLASNLKPHQYLMQKSLSVFAEGFRNMRTSILYSEQGDKPKVVAITSALPGEGKTTTSVCLAATIKMAGDSVIVVDCDLRKRSVNSVFGNAPAKTGLVELLGDLSLLDETIRTDETTGVAYIPLSDGEVTRQDIFSMPEFDQLLVKLKEKFEFVILDSAPVLPVADTRILARKADFVVMLARWRHTPTAAVKAAMSILGSSNVDVPGVVLTQVDLKKQSKFGFGDASYYYKSYKSYYHAS